MKASRRWGLSLLAAIGASLAFAAPAAMADGAMIDDPACWATTLPPNDDESTGAVSIGFTINFFGQSFSTLYVNNNGNVTFDEPLSSYTPFQLSTTDRRIIAPFFADVDTRGEGSAAVTYGFGQTVFEGRPAFCANWAGVGYYGSHTDKLNRFQLLLVDRSDIAPGDFDIVFNYDTITWETGDASGGENGLGGSSARVGYSNGSDRSFEQPGSGTNGALLDSNLVSGLIHNSRNSTTLGRYIFPVRSGSAATGHQIGGRVLANGTTAVQGAYVSACTSDGTCSLTTSSADGAYALGGLADGQYTVSVSPPGMLLPTSQTATVAGADVTLDLHVTGPTPPPPGTAIEPTVGSAGELPVVYWTESTTLTTTGCTGASASYTVMIGSRLIAGGGMTEDSPGHYVAIVPPFYPNTGAAQVRITLTDCPEPTTVEFDIYIDPSGHVVDTEGNGIAGATVTLYRSNTPTGPFVVVADGSAEMSPSNRTNPDLTDAEGHFGWDVIAGYYKVRAEKAGCHAVGNPNVAYTETDVLEIPPPVTDLVLVLDCGDDDGASTSAEGTVGGDVPATLALELGDPASFGAFIPAVTADYSASTTANVISSAGSATLSVADPSETATGHLVNGSYSLASALQARASSAGGTGGAFAAIGGSANPTALLAYAGPVSNDGVSVEFLQHIGSTDPLRSGNYSKTLTFTLATTEP